MAAQLALDLQQGASNSFRPVTFPARHVAGQDFLQRVAGRGKRFFGRRFGLCLDQSLTHRMPRNGRNAESELLKWSNVRAKLRLSTSLWRLRLGSEVSPASRAYHESRHFEVIENPLQQVFRRDLFRFRFIGDDDAVAQHVVAD